MFTEKKLKKREAGPTSVIEIIRKELTPVTGCDTDFYAADLEAKVVGKRASALQRPKSESIATSEGKIRAANWLSFPSAEIARDGGH